MPQINPFKQNVLINGDLIVSGFPTDIHNPVGMFLVYRIVDDHAWYWYASYSRVNAVELAASIGGHAEQIRTIEQSKGDTTCQQNLR